MARQASSFNRGSATLKPQAQILVVCEDSKSSKNYLEDAAQHYRASAKVEVSHIKNTCPKKIVEYAIKNRRKYDEIYCVIDRDNHEHWDAALAIALQNNIPLIKSFPCYEYWILLHFKYTRRCFRGAGKKSDADEVCAELKKINEMKSYQKGVSRKMFTTLLDKLEDAKDRAKRSLEESELDGNHNPSTNLHELIIRFELLGLPQHI